MEIDQPMTSLNFVIEPQAMLLAMDTLASDPDTIDPRGLTTRM